MTSKNSKSLKPRNATRRKQSRPRSCCCMYEVDINICEYAYKQVEMSSSEDSEGSSIHGGICSQTYSGINLCEIDSLEDVLQLAESDPQKPNNETSSTSVNELGKKRGEYNGNHGIDVYQEPEFDDFDPFSDEPHVRPPPTTCGDDGSQHMNQVFINRLLHDDVSMHNDLVCECEYKNKFTLPNLTHEISNEEFTSTPTITVDPTSEQKFLSDLRSHRDAHELEADLNRDFNRFKVHDSIPPDSFKQEYHMQEYSRNKVTVAEEVLCSDLTDEANMPADVSGYDFLTDSELASPINDTESQAAVVEDTSDNTETSVLEESDNTNEEDSEPEQVLLSPPISKESASALARILSNSQFGPGNIQTDITPVVKNTLTPIKVSNQSIYQDACDNLQGDAKSQSELFSKSKSEIPVLTQRLSSRNLTKPSSTSKSQIISCSLKCESLSNPDKNINPAREENNNDASPNSLTTQVTVKDPGYINACTKIFQKLFQMHVSECDIDHSAEAESDDTTPFVIPSESNSDASPPKKIPSIQNIPVPVVNEPSPTPPENYEALVDDELLDYVKRGTAQGEEECRNRVFVEFLISGHLDGNGSLKKRTVVLEFPVDKEDAESAMVIVNNSHLQNPRIQYVNTPSEIVYNLPIDILNNAKHCIGTFKVRCSLRIPVSFKMMCVQQLEIVPLMGIILPSQTINVQVYASTSAKSWIDRLKVEGILLYAAPFVFNRDHSIDNVKLKDIEEFWNKFCGPRFQFAQTRFISIRVYHPNKMVVEPVGFRTRLWDFLKQLNCFAFYPKSKPDLSSFPSGLLGCKQISPLGQMVLRRRHSLALEVLDQAERLNDSRFSLLLVLFLILSACVWYYVHYFLQNMVPQETRLTGFAAWKYNTVKWLAKMYS